MVAVLWGGSLADSSAALATTAPSIPPCKEPMSMPDPEPKESLKAGIEGNVELRAPVGNNGKTLELTGLEGEPVFATPALEAIRKWQFHPVLIGVKPVETVYKIQVRFVLILQEAVTDWEIESPQETAELPSSASTDPKRHARRSSRSCVGDWRGSRSEARSMRPNQNSLECRPPVVFETLPGRRSGNLLIPPLRHRLCESSSSSLF